MILLENKQTFMQVLNVSQKRNINFKTTKTVIMKMTITPTFQKQHIQILQIANELNLSLTDLRNQKENEFFQKKSLNLANSLFGKLLIHLSMEDKVLYPNAINSKNLKLSTKAQQLMTEIGDLKLRFAKYKDTILSKGTIKDIDFFLKETKDLLIILENRIKREEAELYPLFLDEEISIPSLKEIRSPSQMKALFDLD